MEYIALKTFSGPLIGMKRGQVKEISDKKVAKDLLNAGYIKPVKQEKSDAKARGKETL